MNISDRQLIEKILRGDKDATVLFWRRWTSKIGGFFYNSAVIISEDREDLIQEVMMRVFKSLESYNPLYSPSTWIYTIAGNILSDYRKSRVKNLALFNSGEFREEELPPGIGETPEEVCLNRESIGEIRAYVLGKGPLERQIIQLHFYESLSIRKTAKILKLPYETVRYKVRQLKIEIEEVLK